MISETKVIPIRLSTDAIASLDRLATDNRTSRSQIMRDLLENGASVYPLVQEEIERESTNQEERIKALASEIKPIVPEGFNPLIARMTVAMVEAVMEHLIQEMTAQGQQAGDGHSNSRGQAGKSTLGLKSRPRRKGGSPNTR